LYHLAYSNHFTSILLPTIHTVSHVVLYFCINGFRSDDDRRVRRKFDAPKEKPLSHCGRGAASSSRGVAGSSRVSHDRL
jgi:hypothetical protein